MFSIVLTTFIDSHLMIFTFDAFQGKGIHMQECVTAPLLRASKPVPRYLKHGLCTHITAVLRTCKKCRILDPILDLLDQKMQNPSDSSAH